MNRVFLQTTPVRNQETEVRAVSDTLSSVRFRDSDQNNIVQWSKTQQKNEFNLSSGTVISNRLLPYKFQAVPFSNQADAVYVVHTDKNMGFTASRLLKQDNREIRLQQIRNIWNQQTINQVWNMAVSAQLLEDNFFYAFGFFLSIRKIAVKDLKNRLKNKLPADTKEVWDITIWDHNNGSVRAVHQYITTQEPEPAIYRQLNGKEIKVYLVSENEAIIPDMQKGVFELFDLRSSAGKIVSTLHKTDSTGTPLAMAA